MVLSPRGRRVSTTACTTHELCAYSCPVPHSPDGGKHDCDVRAWISFDLRVAMVSVARLVGGSVSCDVRELLCHLRPLLCRPPEHDDRVVLMGVARCLWSLGHVCADTGVCCWFFCCRYVNILAMPALFTVAVLVLPMPEGLKEVLRKGLMKVLFHEIHVGIKMSLFRFLFVVSSVVLMCKSHHSHTCRHAHQAARAHGHARHRACR